MLQTPFHTYYTARMLANMPDIDRFIPVFASAGIKAYPFQIGAASFALRNPYQKGAVLCDEAGMGKSHEAMLVIVQSWLEGKNRILVVIPNADLLVQWVEMLELFYTIPYIVLTNREQWRENSSLDNPNAFMQEGIVVTTYDFAADNELSACEVNWDLTVFEEANALCGVYQENNKQAKALKRLAGDSFKLLLTGTPIEKNIMDLYGLIWFIDETILPDEKEFLARYLRRPENYPELSERVSKYCFRTLRIQAKQYAKVTERILLTDEYAISAKEQKLYQLIYTYINQPKKLAFPEMDQYDLALRLLGLQSSSTAAIKQTIKGIIKRLESMANAQDELQQWQQIQKTAEEIKQDAKAKELLSALKQGFALMKQCGAKKKAVIFTESVETQKMLYKVLSKKYKTLCYNGSVDYSVIRQFKQSGEVLISTDNGAKGFNLEEASFVIHYDLPYNTLKMEQRIDRCHRLGQENDVISLAFINKNNFADVRKLELVNKRMLVTDGVFGVTDDIIGGFTDSLDGGFAQIAERIRSKNAIEKDYQQTLIQNESENKQILAAAEDILFTTFTKELADKITLSPQYISEKATQLNKALWNVVKWFFEQYNAKNNDCFFAIDEENKTITATNYEKLPILFYYWTGSRNKPYQSQKSYGMGQNFKPRAGQITFASVIGRGVIHELACADTGLIEIKGNAEPCEIGLYTVEIYAADKLIKEIPVLVGQTQSGVIMTDEECQKVLSLPVVKFTEHRSPTPHWLKSNGRAHVLDSLVPTEQLLKEQTANLSSAKAEEIDKMKLRTTAKKALLQHSLSDLKTQVQAVENELTATTGDRLKRLALEKQANKLRQELMKREESQFFDAMRLDLELQEQIKEFAEKEKLTAKVIRDFILNVECRV